MRFVSFKRLRRWWALRKDRRGGDPLLDDPEKKRELELLTQIGVGMHGPVGPGGL